MLPVKESLWQLEFVQGVLRKPTFKVSLIQVSNSWDIFDMDNVTWTNAASINVTVIVGICSRCSQGSSIKVLSNRVGNRWDISDIEFVGGWWGVACKVIFVSNPTNVYVELGFWQQFWQICMFERFQLSPSQLVDFSLCNGLTTVLKLEVQLRKRFRVAEG